MTQLRDLRCPIHKDEADNYSREQRHGYGYVMVYVSYVISSLYALCVQENGNDTDDELDN